MAELINFTHTLAVLQEYATAARERYKASLEQHGRKATGQLLSSVSTQMVVGDKTLAVDMDLDAVWKYVEWDTKPHWPPPGTLLKWIQAKPILPTPNADGRIPTPQQLDFLIRRKIARDGTQGTHDLTDTISLLNKEYEEKIADALAEDFGEAVDVIIRTFARA